MESNQNELNMMSDGINDNLGTENVKTRNVEELAGQESVAEKNDPFQKGDEMAARKFVKDTVIDMFKEHCEIRMKTIAENAAAEAAQKVEASMNVEIKALKEQVAARDLEIARLEKERKDLENEKKRNVDAIKEKEEEIGRLKRNAKALRKQLKNSEAQLAETKKELQAEKARHLQTKCKSNVTISKLKTQTGESKKNA